VGVGDDRTIHLTVTVQIQRLELLLDAVVGVDVAEAAADVAAGGDRRQREPLMAIDQAR
jgi:hypothetical protein